jgi:hypothetical protein
MFADRRRLPWDMERRHDRFFEQIEGEETMPEGFSYEAIGDGRVTVHGRPKNGQVWIPGVMDINGKEFRVKEVRAFRGKCGLIVAIAGGVEIINECFSKCRLTTCVFENGCELKEIGTKGFYKSEIGSIEIPLSVEVIGKDCFGECRSLCEIVFQPSCRLMSFGDRAFFHSGLRSVRICRDVEAIGIYCFYGCGVLSQVIFESGRKDLKLSFNSFSNCFSGRLKEIELPARCSNLDGSSFSPLMELTVAEGSDFFIVEGNFLMTKDKKVLIRSHGKDYRVSVGEIVESIGKRCFYNCKRICEITFAGNCRVKAFKQGAFAMSGIKSIRIPTSVEIIGTKCFAFCSSLCEVTFEAGSRLKRLKKEAFGMCDQLESIEFPASLEVIGKFCFSGCKRLRIVTREPGCTIREVGHDIFNGCPVTPDSWILDLASLGGSKLLCSRWDGVI